MSVNRRNVDFYLNADKRTTVDSNGNVLGTNNLPFVHYTEHVLIRLRVVDSDNDPVDLSFASSFSLSIERDKSASTDVLARADGTAFNITGDWADVDVSEGMLSIRLECDTSDYGDWIDELGSKKIDLELKCYDASSNCVGIYSAFILALDVKDRSGTAGSSLGTNYYTKEECNGRYVQGVMGKVSLTIGDVSKTVDDDCSSDLFVKAWLVPPDLAGAQDIACVVPSDFDETGFTAIFSAAIPASGWELHYQRFSEPDVQVAVPV